MIWLRPADHHVCSSSIDRPTTFSLFHHHQILHQNPLFLPGFVRFFQNKDPFKTHRTRLFHISNPIQSNPFANGRTPRRPRGTHHGPRRLRPPRQHRRPSTGPRPSSCPSARRCSSIHSCSRSRPSTSARLIKRSRARTRRDRPRRAESGEQCP